MTDYTGTAGNDAINGQNGPDNFDMTQGGNDRVGGRGDADVFNFGGALTRRDEIDGGDGDDILTLNGDYAAGVTFRSTTITSVEKIVLAGGHDYALTLHDDNITGGFTINGSALGAGDTLTFDGSADTDGAITSFDGAGDDTITTGAGNDVFNMGFGSDTVHAGAGGDIFQYINNGFDAGDFLDGGDGGDYLTLFGDYSAGLTITKDMINSMEVLLLAGSTTFDLTFEHRANDGQMAINAANATAGAVVDGGAERFGVFSFVDSAANDVFIGSRNGDTFDLHNGGIDEIEGKDGADTIHFTDGFGRTDKIDGGFGGDLLELDGDYSAGVVFRNKTITGIDTLKVLGSHDYSLTLHDGNIAVGQELIIDPAALLPGDELMVDATAETDGRIRMMGSASEGTITVFGSDTGDYIVTGDGSDTISGRTGGDFLAGGDGDDEISGGAHDDNLIGGGGTDHLTGGLGHDTYTYFAAADSSGPGRDTITGFNGTVDDFDVLVAVAALDAAITTGTLSEGSFNAHLAAAVGSLAADHAVLFTPDAGGLAGTTFLIVERGGGVGYQSGQDLVVEFDGATHLNALTAASFI